MWRSISRMRRVLVVLAIVVVAIGATGAAVMATRDGGNPSRAVDQTTTTTSTTTTSTTTTTTTLPPLTAPPPNPSGIVNPVEARLPLPPPEGIGLGAEGPLVEAYQARLAEL